MALPRASAARRVYGTVGEQMQHLNSSAPRALSPSLSLSSSVHKPASVDGSSTVTAREAFERVVSALEESTSDKGSECSKMTTKSNLSGLLAAAAVLLQEESKETPQKQTKEQTRALLVLLQKLQVDLDDQHKQHDIAMKKLQAYVDGRFNYMEKAFEDGLNTVSAQALSINERATKFAQLGEALERSLSWVDASKEKDSQVQTRVERLEQEVELLRLSIVGANRMSVPPQGGSLQVSRGPAPIARSDHDVDALKRTNVPLPNARLAARQLSASGQDSPSDGLEKFPKDHHVASSPATTTSDHLSTSGQATSSGTPYAEAVGDLLTRLRSNQPNTLGAQSGVAPAEANEGHTASKMIKEANTLLSSRVRPSLSGINRVDSRGSGGGRFEGSGPVSPQVTMETRSVAGLQPPAQSSTVYTGSPQVNNAPRPFFYKGNKGTTL